MEFSKDQKRNNHLFVKNYRNDEFEYFTLDSISEIPSVDILKQQRDFFAQVKHRAMEKQVQLRKKLDCFAKGTK